MFSDDIKFSSIEGIGLVKSIPKRQAGILLHISSLPSDFGIGDLGTEAYRFVDFLENCKQSYWQTLPVGPTSYPEKYSPYSTLCSMAGNPLLISPDLLAIEGYLSFDDLEKITIKNAEKITYKLVEKNKTDLLEIAWNNYRRKPNKEDTGFNYFCEKEHYWLHDYAIYEVLKSIYNKPWYQWESLYRFRDSQALKKFYHENEEPILKQKWFQYLFFKQWEKLRSYCTNKKIAIIGDIPYYVNHDSADVWVNQSLFSLDNNGEVLKVAGVPPDYFNAAGQLWGMPVFNWENHKKENFNWWIKRIKKNIELFDLIRLDHFRAFVDYWEVPVTEETAINGIWKPAPGKAFFEALKKEIGNLPFIAEDLGDINEEVYNLRDYYNFPGMKILQFAFGDDIAVSPHIPHNYKSNFFVYTGTHDNNTTKGWFKNELDSKGKKHLKQYMGAKPQDKKIHHSLIKLAYASVANTVIIPMQDILGLDETARMNIPATIDENWQWKLLPNYADKKIIKKIKRFVKLYNR